MSKEVKEGGKLAQPKTYNLGFQTNETFEEIVSPSQVITEESPAPSSTFEIAIFSNVGKIEQPAGSSTYIDQTPTDGWIKVDSESAKTYIGGRDYIIDELAKFGRMVHLCTMPYTDELAKEIDSQVRTILIDQDDYKLGATITSLKSATITMIEYATLQKVNEITVVSAIAKTDKKSIMVIKEYGSFNTATGIFDGDKAKLFYAYFTWLKSASMKFPNRKNIEGQYVGELSEEFNKVQRDAGLSVWRRATNKTWLDSMQIGGNDAIAFYTQCFVEYTVRLATSSLYDLPLSQNTLDYGTMKISNSMVAMMQAGIISSDVPSINETRGKAFVVATKEFANYTQQERDAGVVDYLVMFYKFGRVWRVPFTQILKK